jgi:hypothetical protein
MVEGVLRAVFVSIMSHACANDIDVVEARSMPGGGG